MTKREKMLFSKNNKDKKDVVYYKIYKVLDQTKTYNKEKIEAKLIKSLDIKDIRQVYAYLEKEIITLLSTHLKRPKILKDIKYHESQIELFLSKGLASDLEKPFSKLYSKAEQSFQYYKQLDVGYHWIYNLIVNNDPKMESKINEILEAVDNQLPKIKDDIASRKLYSAALFRGIKSLKLLPDESKESIEAKIKEIDELILKTKNPIAESFLFESKFIYYNILEDINGCFDACYDFLKLFDEHPMLKDILLSRYCQKCLQVLMIAALKKDIDPVIEEIKTNLESIKDTSYSVRSVKLLSDVFYFKINIPNLGREDGLKQIRDFEKRILEENVIAYPIINAAFLSVLVHINFTLGEYDNCLNWIIKFEDNVDKDIRNDMRANMKLLAIMCHHTLGNSLLVPYSIKQAYRYFAKNVELNPFEQWSFKSLQEISRKGFSKGLIKKLIAEYQVLEAHDNYTFSREIDYGLWFQAQLEGRAYLDLVIESKNKQKELEHG